MKNRLLPMLAPVVMVLALFGVSSHLLAKPVEQRGSEDRAILGTGLDASVVNGHISYQGYLTDRTTGAPLTGTYNMTFRFWDAVSGGSPVGVDIVKNGVVVAEGLFNVTLDIPDETFDGQGRWIQIRVNDEWLDPRREISPVPYALSLRPGATISGTVDVPMLEVTNARTDGWANAVYGRINSDVTNSAAVFGRSKATTGWSHGVTGGTDSEGGNGVLGYNTASTGSPVGVYGHILAAPDGIGVKGHHEMTSGYGVGVLGETSSPNGSGVAGRNNAKTGNANGIYGESQSPEGYGVSGQNLATTGWATGVIGVSQSSDGRGVEGVNRAGGDGVHGWTAGGNAVGVWGGTNEAGSIGVAGWNGSNGTAIFGQSSAGHGVHGDTEDGSGYYEHAGVWGTSEYIHTFGVLGESIDGIGIQGRIQNTDNTQPALSGYHQGPGTGVDAYSANGLAVYAKSGGDDIIVGANENDEWKFSVSSEGNVYADGTYQSPAADFAELLPAHDGLEPGDVLIIGIDGQLARSVEPYQISVVGVYSTEPGFLGGAAENMDATDKIPLAIVGIVPVKANAENGPIQPGDLLTTSSTPGHAMVCHERLDCIGAIIGKALEPLTKDVGIISVLVTLQ